MPILAFIIYQASKDLNIFIIQYWQGNEQINIDSSL